MQSWSVVEKFSLNCLLISISGNSTWIELEGGWQDGKKNEVFIFLFLFVNSFVCLFFVQCFTIIIIKCKASFSCHSSSSHYSTQGFVLISFHFIFFFKNKENKILCNFTCDLLLCLRISDLKCGQACGKNMTKNSQANGSLRENISDFLIAPSCFNKQKKCRYERTFKERNHLA